MPNPAPTATRNVLTLPYLETPKRSRRECILDLTKDEIIRLKTLRKYHRWVSSQADNLFSLQTVYNHCTTNKIRCVEFDGSLYIMLTPHGMELFNHWQKQRNK